MKYLSHVLVGALLACAQLAHAATITVTSTADTIAVDGQVTLREAITSANNNANLNADVTASGAYGNDTIVFASNVTPTITLSTPLPALTGNLVITGTGVNQLTITSAAPYTNTDYSVFTVGIGGTGIFNNLTIIPGTIAVCIYNKGGNLRVNNCSLIGSSNGVTNTGIYDATSTISRTLTMTNSSVKDFYSGIYSIGITLVISGSTFSHNYSGLVNSYNTATLTNCTFTNNTARAISEDHNATTAINCTIAGNPIGIYQLSDYSVTFRNTISTDPVGGNYLAPTLQGNNITSGNPLLGPLANNGGPTLTMVPLAGSPAIDQGVNPANSPSNLVDQRGLTRPVDDPNIANATGGDGSDIGAVEIQQTNQIFINSVTLIEQNQGFTKVYFTVSLLYTATAPVSVVYYTPLVGGGTATPNTDFLSTYQTLNFAIGERSKAIGISVKGDTLVEPNEDFTVNLGSPTGAIIGVGQGICTIINDD